jgi:hypothetical protein
LVIVHDLLGTVRLLGNHRFYRSLSNTVTENICINV